MIAGPCVIEDHENPFEVCERLVQITSRLAIPFAFKASYRKANRSSVTSFTGIGDREGLEILAEVRRRFNVPVVTDIHSEAEAEMAAPFVDVLQIPAFLCRQTELLHAAAKTGKCVNVKKGQFLSPEAMRQVADKMQDPNNLLAIEYMKAMQRQKVSFEPFTIPRRCVEHDSPLPKDEFASASFIRKAIAEHDPIYGSYIPDFCADLLLRRMKEGRTANIGQLERAVLFKMRTVSFSELMKLPDMTEALAHRFIDNRNANSLEEFYLKVGTKCYTMSRIRRLSMCAMIGIHRDIHRCMPPYARILSFSDRGREMLGMIQKKSAIPVNTSLAKLRDTSEVARAFALTEERASHVYGLAQQSISSAEEDYRARITMVEDRK